MLATMRKLLMARSEKEKPRCEMYVKKYYDREYVERRLIGGGVRLWGQLWYWYAFQASARAPSLVVPCRSVRRITRHGK